MSRTTVVWYSLLMSRVARCPVLNWIVRFLERLVRLKISARTGHR